MWDVIPSDVTSQYPRIADILKLVRYGAPEKHPAGSVAESVQRPVQACGGGVGSILRVARIPTKAHGYSFGTAITARRKLAAAFARRR